MCNEESKISIKPKNNKLIVFPSYLPHEVEINKDKTRLIFFGKFYDEEDQMIKPQELKDKNFKIYLGMPMYGGMVSEATVHGLLELQQWSMANKVGLRFQSMGNESLITRARNTIVSMMMDETDYVATHLLFIDADIGFQWQNVERLLCADKDIVCGIYPRKHLYLEKMKEILEDNPNATSDELEAKALGYNVNFDNPDNLQGHDGFFPVQRGSYRYDVS